MANKYTARSGAIGIQKYIDLRLQGLSLSEIADQFGMPKSSLNNLVRKFRLCSYEGYEPIDIKTIKEDLNTNLSFSRIAYKHDLSVKGLRNYISDYDIGNRLTEENLRKYAATVHTRVEIADYFGVGVRTINTLLRKYKDIRLAK